MNTVTPEALELIAKNAADCRQDRQVPRANVQALKDCGFYRMLLPRQWGGSEHRPQEFFADQILIAEADMSTAWVSGIIAVHAFQIAIMSEQAQRDVYGGRGYPGQQLLQSRGRQGYHRSGWVQGQRALGLELRLSAL